MKIPERKSETLDLIVDDLKKIDNVAAVVLGGSYCTGTANENSDLDIGLYYYEDDPFDIERIGLIAAKYNVGEILTVTDFYQWGVWVNGGAWINTESGEVDLVYRNIEQVRSTVEKSKNGVWENDFEQQPPFGFSSTIYLAETHYCVPLFDPFDVIKELKAQVAVYPVKLKQTIVQQALWAAEFTLWQADKFAAKQDFYNTAGCFTRALKNIVEALLAINETYSLGDKSSVQKIVERRKCPPDLKERIEDILSFNDRSLTINAGKARNLFEQTVTLADGMYRPYFIL